jgi:nucleotide-binding universal stress UspA family protein
MGYKDIVCFLDASEESATRLRIAAALAATHGAHLVGIDATVGDISESSVELRRARFETATREAQLDNTFIVAASLETGAVIHYCADLIVAPSPGGLNRAVARHTLIERALTESGAPMLLLPASVKLGSVGDRVLIAWNGGREALRAVHDAMPFLKRARDVTVFAFSSRPSALQESALLLTEHLERHGVVARLADWTNAQDLSPVEALLACAEDRRTDLVVAGVFGHSRLFEEIFGGVSVELLRQQSAPMLMSH